MPFQINYDQVPIDKQSDQRFVDIYYWMQNKFADPKAVEEVCFHEGGHFFYSIASGATNIEVKEPHIFYDPRRNDFDHTSGSVQAVEWNDTFTNSSVLNRAYLMAIIGAAGEIVTTTLLGVGFGSGLGDKQAFHALCLQLKISYNQEVKTWRTAEEYVRSDLKNSAIQDGIRVAAEEVEPLIFKPL
jgi:hypothetical protein